MANVFLSYKQEDVGIANRFIAALLAEGLSVWWDDEITPAEAWDSIIEREIIAAQAVVVLWTPRSVASEWVRKEATVAHKMQKLIPIVVEETTVPIAFILTQTLNLTEWDGARENPKWVKLLRWITKLVSTLSVSVEAPVNVAPVNVAPTNAAPINAAPINASPAKVASVALASPKSTTPSDMGRVLMIHGYSAAGRDFFPWKQALEDAGIPSDVIEVGNYVSLNNEVTIKDLGEGFDRALRLSKFASEIPGNAWTFDAIVHSTGMLVLRQWLTSDPYQPGDPRSRIGRLKHLVGLAPATFGSPQAKKGRSWLGALVKGAKELGPDFLNAGDLVLDGLELGSKYTWDLATKDMTCTTPFYDKGPDTPYVAVFIGNTPYTGLAALASAPGTDGTVRWAGCAMNTRKVSLDFRRHPQLDPNDPTKRCAISDWSTARAAAPIIAVDGKNHGTILAEPDPQVVQMVRDFLAISAAGAYDQWEAQALAFGAPSMAKMDQSSGGGSDGAGWQQLVIHMVDDHGDGVTDYNLQIYIGDSLDQSNDPQFPSVPLIANAYTSDNSYRCFYIHLTKDMLTLDNGSGPKKMWLELIASTGSALIEYEAYTGSPQDPQRLAMTSHDPSDNLPVKMDITALTEGGASLLYPYTTTLLEIFVEREPMPLQAVSSLFTFLSPDE